MEEANNSSGPTSLRFLQLKDAFQRFSTMGLDCIDYDVRSGAASCSPTHHSIQTSATLLTCGRVRCCTLQTFGRLFAQLPPRLLPPLWDLYKKASAWIASQLADSANSIGHALPETGCWARHLVGRWCVLPMGNRSHTQPLESAHT